MKFGRTYSMVIDGDANVHEVDFPITLSFDINRDTLSSANTGHFTLYNLAEDVRRDVFHDYYDIGTKSFRRIRLQAGYESELFQPIVFEGNIISAYSRRQGANWLTEIEAYDGSLGMANSQVSTTLPAGWDLRAAITSLAGSLKDIATGSIGNFKQQNSRGLILSGNAWDNVQNLVKFQEGVAFVDNGKFHALLPDEYIASASSIPLVNSDTGLLNSTKRKKLIIDADIIFEPRAAIGHLVQYESIESVNDGLFRVNAVKHRGTISGAVGGDLTTTLSLWAGAAGKLVPVAAP